MFKGTALVIGGNRTTISRVPWHAGIYKREDSRSKYQQRCGGTIITARLVVSAMHCFWDRSMNAQDDTSTYKIAVGKTLRDYDATEDLTPQFFSIERIESVPGYNDIYGYYANDIVVIVLEKHIEFGSHIVPICLPDHLDYYERNVPGGWTGLVAG